MVRAVQLAFLFWFSMAATATAQELRIYSPPIALGDNTTADLRIIEDRGEGTTTFDLCYAFNVDNSNGVLTLGDYDRLLLPLRADGASLTGNATSSEKKEPVAVKLQRRAASDGRLVFSGIIEIGGKSFPVTSEPTGGAEPSPETEYVNIVEGPEGFDEGNSPNTVGIKYRRGTLPVLLEALRDANVKIDLTSSAIDRCASLRSGEEYLRLITAPEESQALVERLRKLPNVLRAGWSTPQLWTPTVRVGKARWVSKGVLDRQKVAGDLAAAVAKHVGASITGTNWDAKSGELKVSFKRPSKLFPGLGLTETYQMTALVTADRFGETNNALIWGPTISGEVVDERSGNRLTFVPLYLYAGPPEGIVINVEPEILAALLDAESWNSSDGVWVKR
ncbi:MAG TPA: hypothetical protein PL193_17810 [Xanthobacteraceae bacterium]|nr:hypothetical protein [Xanthobacteraceae bacterium]